MKHLLLLTFSIFTIYINGQVNCPLNTPEFPFETQDDLWDTYSWSAGLYMPVQMGGAQTMTSISFRLDNDWSWGNYTYNNIHIYLRHTSVNNYASSPGYPGTAGFTEVYSGNMTFNGPGVYSYTFNVAGSFAYNGSDNLEVLFENRGGNYYSEEPWFDRTNATPAGVFPGKVWAGSTWANAISGSSNRQFNLQINNVMGCGPFPLGVTFTKSDLICEGNKVNLSWSVAAEENNDYYTIEKSIDGRNYEKVKTIQGAGTTSNPLDYNVVLDKTRSELTYYRLSQTDFDGTHTVLVTHAAQCSSEEIKVSPNPFNDFFTIYSNGEINQLSLTNALGEKIKIDKTVYNNRVVVNTNTLRNGVYFLTVKTANESKIHRLVKN